MFDTLCSNYFKILLLKNTKSDSPYLFSCILKLINHHLWLFLWCHYKCFEILTIIFMILDFFCWRSETGNCIILWHKTCVSMSTDHGSVDRDLVTLYRSWSFLQICLKHSNTLPDHQVVSLVLWCSWKVYSPAIFKFLSLRWYNSEMKNTNNYITFLTQYCNIIKPIW